MLHPVDVIREALWCVLVIQHLNNIKILLRLNDPFNLIWLYTLRELLVFIKCLGKISNRVFVLRMIYNFLYV